MNKKPVRENMSTHLITIGWGDSMKNAYLRMHSKHVRHLPVINDAGEIIGILSDRDVQRSMISQMEREPGRVISDETIEFDPESRVRDYMSWPAMSVDQNSDLRLVAEKMVTEKISSFLVRKGDSVVGIVTAEDLLKVLVELLSDPRTPIRWTLDHVLEGTFSKLPNTLF